MLSNKDLLAEAREHFERKDTKKSLDVCLAYLNVYPEDIIAIRLKANLLNIECRPTEAIEAISQVIDLKFKKEPCDYFYRGRWLLLTGDIEGACADLHKVIALSSEYNDTYYTEIAYLHLAHAYAISGNMEETKKILPYIGDACTTSLHSALITKDYYSVF